MTFCKILAETQRGPDAVTAYEKTEKNSRSAKYEIVESRDGIAHTVTKTAKTTWKKKFQEIIKN